MSFTHLNVSSSYSAHYGVSHPKQLAQAAKAQGAQMLALTDRDGLYGTVKHVAACMAEGLHPILGVNLAVLDSHGEAQGRIVLLARGRCNGAGYAALCRAITLAHGTSHGVPGLEAGQLAHLGAGGNLMILLGGESDVARAILKGNYAHARALLASWKKRLGKMLRVEITTHLSSPGSRYSLGEAGRLLRYAHEREIKAVLTNAVRYVDPDGAVTADILDSARALHSLKNLDSCQPNGQGWLKTPQEMRQLAKEIGYATERSWAHQLLRETEALAEWAAADPVADLGWKKPVIPEARVLGLDRPAMQELTSRVYGAVPGLLGDADLNLVEECLARELGVIDRLDFAGYFLTVAETVKLITGMGIRVAARGSGASSLVNYLLGISQVNPLTHDLVFERFLSDTRTTLPDIDIDVESARRHEIYREIFANFGEERVSLMSMQNAYRARGAVRDAGAALGVEQEQVDEIAKQLWRFSASSFREALTEKPELAALAERITDDTQLDILIDATERLDRLPRHISMHPCGVILSDASLLDRTPVQPSGIGLQMSQFDKHDMDLMGLIKLDVLGVRMQSAIAYTLEEIARMHPDKQSVARAGGHVDDSYISAAGAIDLSRVPLDDEPTFELIRSTHTLGCFQIESPGQRELIGKLAPREFNDLIIDISLFRPGPMQSNMVKPYLEHRHGFAPAQYLHPDLIPALAETHGVTVFHEQVLRILDVMTGCGLGMADVYRRLLGNPDKEPAVERYVRTEATKRGYSQETIDKVWEVLSGFGSFGFCKAHGAAFAVPTYHSAWLKAHHPEAFLAGIWEHDPGMYPKRLLVSEARRMGIPILPLDINRSTGHYRVERVFESAPAKLPVVPRAPSSLRPGRYGVRLAFRDIHQMSEREVERLVAGQPYEHLADVRARAGLSRRTYQNLAALGVFDSLLAGTSRADTIAHTQSMAHSSLPAKYRPGPGQLALDLGKIEHIKATGTELEPAEVVRTELDLMHLDASEHLISSYRQRLAHLPITQAAELLQLRNGTEVLVAGVRVATQTPPMRGGKRVVFISVDDGTGCIDATFFDDTQQRTGPLLFSTRMLLIHGVTRRTGPRGISLQALNAWDLHQPETLPAAGYLEEQGRPQISYRPKLGEGARSIESVGELAKRMEAEGLDQRGA
ncbi:DNA polymerase III subunit alpha [Glutamicibacter nicotianae]|uniref:DNA polymerase III subunit alpha n=1 Tax=Glutamicibacter nicotianae TaxID=37929 RepID=UPI000EF8CEDF|nr:DNA polymerase III subunit alpha [Glutamicibacter nicotianae]WIV42454.1 DNA polymerase III subunit alpha [Glutamicibacter nicotianae]